MTTSNDRLSSALCGHFLSFFDEKKCQRKRELESNHMRGSNEILILVKSQKSPVLSVIKSELGWHLL